MKKLQGKIVAPAVQPIKRTITEKTYTETAVGSTVPIKTTIKPSAKPPSKPSARAVMDAKFEKIERKQMEEPWRVVRGTRFSKTNAWTKFPQMLDGVKVTKKDFCISGLPVNLVMKI